MNAWIYWIGWGVITAIYAIHWIWQYREYKKSIAIREIQVAIYRQMTEDYIKRIRELRKENEKLKGAKGDDRN